MTLEEYEALMADKRNQFRKQPTKASNNKEDFSGKHNLYMQHFSLSSCARFISFALAMCTTA